MLKGIIYIKKFNNLLNSIVYIIYYILLFFLLILELRDPLLKVLIF